jgi:hypothetical protein
MNANSERDEIIVFFRCDELIAFYRSAMRRSTLGQDSSMTTLTNIPLAPLLDRLFAQAAAATSQAMAAISREEIGRMMHSKTEYQNCYSLRRLKYGT